MGLFTDLEKKKRQKIILLLNQFLSKGSFEGMEELVEDIVFDSGCPGFSKIVNDIGAIIEKDVDKGFSTQNAIKIIEKLKSPQWEGGFTL